MSVSGRQISVACGVALVLLLVVVIGLLVYPNSYRTTGKKFADVAYRIYGQIGYMVNFWLVPFVNCHLVNNNLIRNFSYLKLYQRSVAVTRSSSLVPKPATRWRLRLRPLVPKSDARWPVVI